MKFLALAIVVLLGVANAVDLSKRLHEKGLQGKGLKGFDKKAIRDAETT